MYHPDEYDYIFNSYFLKLLLKKDMTNVVWQSFNSYDQPKLSSYLYGVGLIIFREHYFDTDVTKNSLARLAYAREEGGFCNEINNTNNYSLINCMYVPRNNILWKYTNFDKKYLEGKILSPELERAFQAITTLRVISTLLSIGSLIIIFFIGLNSSYFCGILSMILLYNNSLFQITTIRSMGDSPLLFFILLTILFAIKHIQKMSERSSKLAIVFAVLTGIAGGLAMSSKINGIISIIYAGSLTIWYIIKNYSMPKKLALSLVSLFIYIGLTLIVFIILNPFTWASPLKNVIFMYRHWIIQSQYFQTLYSYSAMPTLNQRFSMIIHQTISPGGAYINFPSLGIVHTLLYGAGLMMLIFSLFNKTNRNKKNINFQILLLHLLFFIIMTIYVAIDWDRYYLPIIFSVVLIQSYALANFYHLIIRYVTLLSMNKN